MGAIADLVDLVSKLVRSVQDRKFAAELREVQCMIGGLQSDQAALTEKNIALTTENAELKQKLTALLNVTKPGPTGPVFKRQVYWLENDQIPLCPHCFEAKQIQVHLSGPWNEGAIRGERWDCNICNHQYTAQPDQDFRKERAF